MNNNAVKTEQIYFTSLQISNITSTNHKLICKRIDAIVEKGLPKSEFIKVRDLEDSSKYYYNLTLKGVILLTNSFKMESRMKLVNAMTNLESYCSHLSPASLSKALYMVADKQAELERKDLELKRKEQEFKAYIANESSNWHPLRDVTDETKKDEENNSERIADMIADNLYNKLCNSSLKTLSTTKLYPNVIE